MNSTNKLEETRYYRQYCFPVVNERPEDRTKERKNFDGLNWTES